MATKLDKDIRAVIEEMEPKIGRAFLESINDIRSEFRLATITKALREGRIEDAIAALHLTGDFYAPLRAAIVASFILGGVRFASGLPRLRRPSSGGRTAIRFNAEAATARDFIVRQVNAVIEVIAREQRFIVSDVINAGLNAGKTHQAIALDLAGRINPLTGKRIGGVLGLNRPQVSTLDSVKRALASNDKTALRAYLTHKARDARMDGRVREVIKTGKAMSAKDAAKIADRYAQRQLMVRAKTVAQHEAFKSANAGVIESMKQIVDTGLIREEQIIRKWNSRGDDRVRHTHSIMDGQTVSGINTPFVSPSGARMLYPHDTSLGAGPDEVVNCRCRVDARLDVRTVPSSGGWTITPRERVFA